MRSSTILGGSAYIIFSGKEKQAVNFSPAETKYLGVVPAKQIIEGVKSVNNLYHKFGGDIGSNAYVSVALSGAFKEITKDKIVISGTGGEVEIANELKLSPEYFDPAVSGQSNYQKSSAEKIKTGRETQDGPWRHAAGGRKKQN